MEKIKRIIMGLLAKASGTDNAHEAEVFLAKAMELMQKYQLDIADMVDVGDPIISHVGLSQAESGHAWRWKLYSAVAKLYGCKSVHYGVGYRPGLKGKPTPWFEQRLVGRESAIITTDLMYPWIVEQVRKAAKEIAALTGMSEQGQAKRVAAALIVRIYDIIAAQEQNQMETPVKRNALLILDQVSAAYKRLYPEAKLVKSHGSRTDTLSKLAADGIGLHRQTKTTAQRRLTSG